MARIHGSSHAGLRPLEGWPRAVAPEPGVKPQDAAGLRWIPAPAPGTTAHALEAAGASTESLFGLDGKEVWSRCEFGGEPGPAGTRALRFGGLATLCDAWVNGQHALR